MMCCRLYVENLFTPRSVIYMANYTKNKTVHHQLHILSIWGCIDQDNYSFILMKMLKSDKYLE